MCLDKEENPVFRGTFKAACRFQFCKCNQSCVHIKYYTFHVVVGRNGLCYIKKFRNNFNHSDVYLTSYLSNLISIN